MIKPNPKFLCSPHVQSTTHNSFNGRAWACFRVEELWHAPSDRRQPTLLYWRAMSRVKIWNVCVSNDFMVKKNQTWNRIFTYTGGETSRTTKLNNLHCLLPTLVQMPALVFTFSEHHLPLAWRSTSIICFSLDHPSVIWTAYPTLVV